MTDGKKSFTIRTSTENYDAITKFYYAHKGILWHCLNDFFNDAVHEFMQNIIEGKNINKRFDLIDKRLVEIEEKINLNKKPKPNLKNMLRS